MPCSTRIELLSYSFYHSHFAPTMQSLTALGRMEQRHLYNSPNDGSTLGGFISDYF